MKNNARKYLRLDNAISAAQKQEEKHNSGYFFNIKIRDSFTAKAKEYQDKQNESVEILTNEEKDEIEAYYLCGEMFERD